MPKNIVCFGELLLRLGAPGHERLLQTPRLDVVVGGAEANVAVALAQLGHAAAMVSVVPDNALGVATVGELRRHGVDVAAVHTGAGRQGLYFLATGAMHRASEVLYDRAQSAFALASASGYDWPRLLAGADLLHLSGVTPALGAETAAAAIAAARVARTAGVQVSFDGNYRAKLWAAWDSDPPVVLRQLFAEADIAFADHRDIELVLGQTTSGDSREQRIEAAARQAFGAFPHLQRIVTTLRTQHSVDHHELGAMMVTRDGGVHRTTDYTLTAIVDRIGTGDAFAAGVLHGLSSAMTDADALHFGLAAACLKHSEPGDFSRANQMEIEAVMAGTGFDVRR
ncbi:2-dehydro-3-deoxygluconokinase [Luteimonas cucumeris]|uniref:2-dehydro-3-deoxygluconokinase n=1 Tax=Luteimonas cucumeris TaxID=985012 RepID=A0A562LDM5_9GAMM|nr:sugar kinase [Luteimonas cucumeris]TWI05782.1 2-dehydro-3-deoxygluconokinase [Luteimonas cucumeris]